MKNVYLTILIIIVLRGAFVVWSDRGCLKIGRCENISVEKTEKENLILLNKPQPNETISSPLVIKGEARGNWFFEASFPVVLVDWDGRIIAESYATAKSDWMTEDFVPFEATIEFEEPEFIGDFSKRGALILKKDNPSGLPEYDDALEITVFFE